jgi:hypothetical protein
VSRKEKDISAKEAGRILCGVFLVGLFLSFFVGEIAITLTAFPIAALLLRWLVIGFRREIGPAIRRKAWTTVVLIGIEYAVFIGLLGLIVWTVVEMLMDEYGFPF